MQVLLLAFASAAEAIGQDELDLELPDGITTDQLEHQLLDRFPDLAPLWDRLAVALDGQLITDTQEIPSGCEIALLPPVSGGATDRPFVALSDQPIDTDSIVRHLSRPDCGAVLLFYGNVRNHHDGRAVRSLNYRAYRRMASERLATIVTELEETSERLQVAIVHRVGEVPIGEPSVVIGAASPHREAAYEASRTALERLKQEVPIWKYEQYEDGDARWREEESLRQTPVPDRLSARRY